MPTNNQIEQNVITALQADTTPRQTWDHDFTHQLPANPTQEQIDELATRVHDAINRPRKGRDLAYDVQVSTTRTGRAVRIRIRYTS